MFLLICFLELKKKKRRGRGREERKGKDWIGWVDAWYDYTKSTEKEEDSRGAIGNASFLSACLGLSRSFFLSRWREEVKRV